MKAIEPTTVPCTIVHIEEYGMYLSNDDKVVLVLITETGITSPIRSLHHAFRIGDCVMVMITGYVAEMDTYRGSIVKTLDRDSFVNRTPISEQEALDADRAGDLQLAASRYEASLANGANLDMSLNLAVLYWQATDPGMAAAQKYLPRFYAMAGRRFRELLAEAQRQFPDRTEPRFWSRYIAWADLGEPFSSNECMDLLREEPTCLVPAMHVFALSDGTEARPEALELLRQCHDDPTTRTRYMASVIEATIGSRS
jgi:hypothetical protein